MNDERFERELRERFQRLRAQESADAPDFEAMLSLARERAASEAEEVREGHGRGSAPVVPIRRGRRWGAPWARGLMASGLAAAAIAVLWLAPGAGPAGSVSDEEFDALLRSYSEQANGGLWTAPTDGLLEVPGIELVRSVPSIGGYQTPEGERPTGDNG